MNSLEKLCKDVLSALKTEQYTTWGIGKHTKTFDVFCKYASSKGVDTYSEELAKAFIMERYHVSLEGKNGQRSQFVTQRITHLKKLSHYFCHGNIRYYRENGQKFKVDCPHTHNDLFLAFMDYYRNRDDYAHSTLAQMDFRIKKFLEYLDKIGIFSIGKVTSKNISDYLELHRGQSKWYLKTIISCLNIFFHYAHENHLSDTDLSLWLPKIHHIRDAFLPSFINEAEVKELINIIDTTTPVGKRDLALLLLASQMGLRSCDIKTLRTRDFIWSERLLIINQKKTRKSLRVPIPQETGWAIIDYLKNGRPDTDTDFIFIKHSPGGGLFSQKNHLQSVLHKYIRKAGLEYPDEEHRGLHSLRSSYAKILLDNETPLPVITSLLGHSSTMSTSHYLRIDLLSLRQCAIDVEEVIRNA
jgi:site-specific recombinase XerD